MTIRTVEFGSTDWVDGEILDAADLNETMNVSAQLRNFMLGQISNIRMAARANLASASVLSTTKGIQDATMRNDASDSGFNDYDTGSYSGPMMLATTNDSAAGVWTSLSYGLHETISKGTVFVNYKVNDILDDFADGVLSGDWNDTIVGSYAIVTETVGVLSVNMQIGTGTSSAKARYEGVDFFGTNKIVRIFQNFTIPSNYTTCYLGISNGSSAQSLITYTSSSGYQAIELYFDSVNGRVLVFVDEELVSDVNLSSITTNWYLEWYVSGTNSSNAGFSIYSVAVDSVSPSSTVTARVRLDGANWEAIDVNTGGFHEFSNTGGEPEIELTATPSTGEQVVLKGHAFSWL